MKFAKFLTLTSVTVFGILATTVSAFAVAATANAAVNVRTGPGVGFNKVDTLVSGEAVNVTQCQDGWCYVEQDGPDGWVSGGYLSAVDENTTTETTTSESDTSASDTSASDDAAAAAAIQIFGSILGAVVSNATPPPPPPPTPQVCFYNGNNFTGASFCVDAGDQDNQLTGFWNNKMSSVQVQAGANVKICRNWFFGGSCQTYNSNVNSLIPLLNNSASSYQTF